MLINAQRAEEVRVAVVSGSTLDAYRVSVAQAGQLRGNIYRGVVVSIQASLDAAFVDFGAAKHGFLPADEVVAEAAHRAPQAAGRSRADHLLERGRPLLVQVSKEPGGEKGAALTTNVSLAGRYLVFTPFDDTRGISRKVEDDDVRRQLREIADKLEVPAGSGMILRTAALGQSKSTLTRDLAALLRLWKKIHTRFKSGKGPLLIYSDQDLIVQAVRDTLDASIDEVLVDDDDAFERVSAAMRSFMPRAKTGLVRYTDRVPLFSRFGLESQIEQIFKPRVPLPSGGSIVIEGTEALTAVDVNSGRTSRGGSNEDTYLATNLEAAREVARQLRLRDIGGLVVVDFIDMRAPRHRREVEKTLRDAVKVDRARTDIGKISHNGLLEINRQRLGTPLEARTHRSCPTCGGAGTIPSAETVSLNLLRRIEERAATSPLAAVRVALHPELADAFQNQHRQALAALEREFDLHIEIVAATHLHRSQEDVNWTARDPREMRRAPAPAAVAVAELTEEEPEGAAEVDPEAKAGKTKKRRRGGRRRRKDPTTGEPQVAAPHAEDEAPDEESAEEPSAGGPEREPQPASKVKRRRRGGRRHRKTPPGGAATSDEGAAPSREAAAETSGGEAAAPESAPTGTAEASSKRRKRRRRRSTRKGDAAGAPAEGGTGETPPAE
jgi:ribonuclease E